MTSSHSEQDSLCVNTIRALSIDAVEAARSGHPGAPLGAALVAYVLWDRFLKHNPADPQWPDRDRFVLSAGHASALLYSLLYLTGYDLSLDELRAFRQWGSKAAGHPEKGLTPGVEVTTGPLGQGFANAVGMAMAERWLAARYNRPNHTIVDHRTYCIASDGDLQEGVSSEAASLAGTLKLGKLVVLYDSNGISIEGSTAMTFTEDIAGRFTAFGWQVIGPIDGLCFQAVEQALHDAQSDTTRPTLIICQTTIGYGSPNKAGSAASHGEPLGAEEVTLTKRQLGWPYDEPFTVPQQALAVMRRAMARGVTNQSKWNQRYVAYRREYPVEGAAFERETRNRLPDGWETALQGVIAGDSAMATRVTAGMALNALAAAIPSIIGGSADLSPSTKTRISGSADFGPSDYSGRNIRFGVREHAMAAVCNGLALHGGTIPFASTFLVFSDYMRPAIRLASMMCLQIVFVFTHDSIGVGEDGPTHQPVEHILGLRSVPGLTVIRPADAAEAIEAWRAAVTNLTGPTALILTRQNVPAIDRSKGQPAAALARGAYIVWEPEHAVDMILIATGSEVNIAIRAASELWQQGIAARVVSMPSWELFEAQPQEYRDQVLPPSLEKRISIEAGVTLGWERYVGAKGVALGVDHFGKSAPGATLYKEFGLTPEKVMNTACMLVKEEIQ